VLQTLAARGWVESRLGRTGGFALLRPLREIRVGDLIELLHRTSSIGTCLLGNRSCDPTRPCFAHVRWSEAQRSARAAIGELRLADLLDGEIRHAVIAAAPSNGGHAVLHATIEEVQ
jgi:Rrf2 family protein